MPLENPSSLYVGDVVLIGLNDVGSNVAGFCYSRKDVADRRRRLEVEDDVVHLVFGNDPRPLAETHVFYDPLIVRKFGYSPYAIVGNGEQTRSIDNRIPEENFFADKKPLLRKALKYHGHNRDEDKTPNIAAITVPYHGWDNMGIITEDDVRNVELERVKQYPGYYQWLSTHYGHFDESMCEYVSHLPESTRLKIIRWAGYVDTGQSEIPGRNAQEIADGLFDWMNPKYVVATAAAVFNDKNDWDLAVRNLSD